MVHHFFRTLRGPFAPSFDRRIAAVEKKVSVRRKMRCNGCEHGLSILPTQEHLESVPRQDNQIEAASKPDGAGIGFDPFDFIAT